ncbi:MAG: hypothetical protein N2594_08320 [Clostridiales bacterium]|nr:hypothetical protein [Clostridiales bacterium]
MRIDFQKALKNCKKCPRYSDKPIFGKCLATRSDILKCAYRELNKMFGGIDNE